MADDEYTNMKALTLQVSATKNINEFGLYTVILYMYKKGHSFYRNRIVRTRQPLFLLVETGSNILHTVFHTFQ